MFFLNTEICHVHHHLINKAKVEVSRTENNSGFYLNVTFQDKLFFKTNKLLSLTHPIKCYCIVRSPTLQIVIMVQFGCTCTSPIKCFRWRMCIGLELCFKSKVKVMADLLVCVKSLPDNVLVLFPLGPIRLIIYPRSAFG